MKLLIVIISLISSNHLHAQKWIDYLKIREISCSNNDSISMNQSLENLLKIDATTIKKGLDQYYYDLGMVYYSKVYLFKEKEFIAKAISCFENCFRNDKKKWEAYKNLVIIYCYENNIEMAKKYILLYKKYCKKENWDNQLIQIIERK